MSMPKFKSDLVKLYDLKHKTAAFSRVKSLLGLSSRRNWTIFPRSMVNEDKETMIRRSRETVQRGGSIFVGPDSVVSTLGVENE